MMGKSKPGTSYVVKAINHYKKRSIKADLDLLSVYLTKYSMTPDDIKVEIEKLLQEKIITAIECEGKMIYSIESTSSKTSVIENGGTVNVDQNSNSTPSVTNSLTTPSTADSALDMCQSSEGPDSKPSPGISVEKLKSNDDTSNIAISESNPPSKVLRTGFDSSTDEEETVYENGGGHLVSHEDEDSSTENIEQTLLEKPALPLTVKKSLVSSDSTDTIPGEIFPANHLESVVSRDEACDSDTDSERLHIDMPQNVNSEGSHAGAVEWVNGNAMSHPQKQRKGSTGRPSYKRSRSHTGGRRKKMKRSHAVDSETVGIAAKRPRHDSDANSTGSKGSTSTRGSLGAGSTGAKSSLSVGVAKCDFCQMTSQRNRLGIREELLMCKDCDAKAHPSCMEYSDELAARAARSPWQCIDCKTCNVCLDSGDADAMLFCDSCDKGYHMNCHNPPIIDKPNGKWVCCACVLEHGSSDSLVNEEDKLHDQLQHDTDVNKNHIITETGKSGLSLKTRTPSISPALFYTTVNGTSSASSSKPISLQNGGSSTVTNGFLTGTSGVGNGKVSPFPQLPRLSTTLCGPVPDAAGWSCTEVSRYFHNLGFTEQSKTFTEQEIDGSALLLLTRSDVLTGLSFKLGPALKIYAHIQRLQSWSG